MHHISGKPLQLLPSQVGFFLFRYCYCGRRDRASALAQLLFIFKPRRNEHESNQRVEP
jgi:hypothetical protein